MCVRERETERQRDRGKERARAYVDKFQRGTNLNMKDSGTNVVISFSIPSSGMSKHMPRALNDTAIHASNYIQLTHKHILTLAL